MLPKLSTNYAIFEGNSWMNVWVVNNDFREIQQHRKSLTPHYLSVMALRFDIAFDLPGENNQAQATAGVD